MKLIAIYSKWSKRVCWLVYSKNYKHAMSWLEKRKVPYARNMYRWAVFEPNVAQVKDFLLKDHRDIPVVSDKGLEIGKKRISIKNKKDDCDNIDWDGFIKDAVENLPEFVGTEWNNTNK